MHDHDLHVLVAWKYMSLTKHWKIVWCYPRMKVGVSNAISPYELKPICSKITITCVWVIGIKSYSIPFSISNSSLRDFQGVSHYRSLYSKIGSWSFQGNPERVIVRKTSWWIKTKGEIYSMVTHIYSIINWLYHMIYMRSVPLNCSEIKQIEAFWARSQRNPAKETSKCSASILSAANCHSLRA